MLVMLGSICYCHFALWDIKAVSQGMMTSLISRVSYCWSW